MSKRLYRGNISYHVYFVARVDDDPVDVLKSHVLGVVTNEEASCELTFEGTVHSMDRHHPWYDRIPYGDEKGMPCSYYTDEAIRERRDVVAMVKSTLTAKEWDALAAHFKSSDP